jgi:hypothetical protein
MESAMADEPDDLILDAVRPEPDEYRYISEFLCKNDSVR